MLSPPAHWHQYSFQLMLMMCLLLLVDQNGFQLMLMLLGSPAGWRQDSFQLMLMMLSPPAGWPKRFPADAHTSFGHFIGVANASLAKGGMSWTWRSVQSFWEIQT